MKPDAARYAFRDAKSRPVQIHGASIAYNAYREALDPHRRRARPEGHAVPPGRGVVRRGRRPRRGRGAGRSRSRRHPRYTFYNPRHHAFLDADGGRVIYFEGTYTRTFSGNPTPTPRYEYNQFMYRLDLADERLKAAR